MIIQKVIVATIAAAVITSAGVVGVGLAAHVRANKLQAASYVNAFVQPATSTPAPVDERYTVHFADGADIQLIAVSYDATKGPNEMWWRPDGTPIGIGAFNPVGVNANPKDRRVFIFRSRGLPDDAAWAFVAIGEEADSDTILHADGTRASDLRSLDCSAPPNGTIRFQVSERTGAWTTLATASARDVIEGNIQTPSDGSISYFHTPDENGRLTIGVATKTHGHLPVEVQDVRLVALDDAGKEHVNTTSGWSHDDDNRGTGDWIKVGFPDLTFDRLKQITVQSRPWNWMYGSFNNIALQPNS